MISDKTYIEIENWLEEIHDKPSTIIIDIKISTQTGYTKKFNQTLWFSKKEEE